MELHSKEEFQKLFLSIVNPLKPHFTAERAGIDIGVTGASYGQDSIYMEAFSRPLWGLVPFFSGGGSDEEWQEIYRKGLAAGTDPENPECWGIPDSCGQKFVEMAAIAYAFLEAPDIFWEPLSDREKENVERFLLTINEHPLPLCNWQFFAVLVNLAMKKLGRKYDKEKLAAYLERIESFYLGNGWYQDGDSTQKDYYISFAFHYYGLMYARYMQADDPERCERFKECACTFAKDFIYWFDEDGEGLPFGRSLTYRFAQASFWSACLLAGIEPFPLDVMKGLIVRHLEWWMKQPIFDREHLLTIGYAYPNLVMAERYNAPGSPYWSMKIFAMLLLPDDHPFFHVQAAPFPKLPDTKPLPEADMLMKRYPHHVTAYTPGVYSPYGHGQIVAKYGKFAYDTKFGFSVAKSCYEIHENAPDSMLAFEIDGYIYVRRICISHEITKTSCRSVWSPYPGITVETTVTPTEKGHVRLHRIVSSLSCTAYDCGFSVASQEKDRYLESTDGASAFSGNRMLYCRVEAKKTAGRGIVIGADPNTNLLYPQTRIPAVRYEIAEGETVLETEVTAEVHGGSE